HQTLPAATTGPPYGLDARSARQSMFFFSPTSHSTGRPLTFVLTKLRSTLPPHMTQSSAVLSTFGPALSLPTSRGIANRTAAASTAQVTAAATKRPSAG